MTWQKWGCVLIWCLLVALSLGAGFAALWAAAAVLLGVGLAWIAHPDRPWNRVDDE